VIVLPGDVALKDRRPGGTRTLSRTEIRPLPIDEELNVLGRTPESIGKDHDPRAARDAPEPMQS